MKKIFIWAFALLLSSFSFAQENQVKFEIETSYGTMSGVLYNETPQHRDNFIKLVNEGWYEDSPFHRVIKNFMIQGGGNKDGRPDPGYKVPAEFMPTKYVHKKGALAAARQGDNVNPTKASSGSQFYIVQGKLTNDAALLSTERKITQGMQQGLITEYITRPENMGLYQKIDSLQRARNGAALNAYVQEVVIVQMKNEGIPMDGFKYSEKQKAVYRTLGGTPHLDGGYTVFGEITQGLEVIDKIAAVQTAAANKPVQELSMKIKIVE
ncbi:MAG: peptidylprolyl isomerase [Bacteroidetes bacterium 4572_77]|nr:MAG: peptidylprolyl isomerase [Bacteroidetes bacterium 4572_77]